VVFAQTLFTRAIDPVIPMIADDLAIDVKTAALLSSAYTFPYALVQPALGVTGDFFGKTRLMNLCLLVVALSALVCAVATNFSLLVAMRVAAGLVAGGVFPVAMALTGDLVPVNQRQVAIGRLLAVGLTGNLVGSSIAGVIGDLFGWRGVFVILGSFGLIVTIAAFFAFRGVVAPPPARFSRAASGARHFANIQPRSSGKFYRGSWQCQYGCKLEADSKPAEDPHPLSQRF
jgi:MFS transporter, DHA1 family, inner membrane transport protein